MPGPTKPEVRRETVPFLSRWSLEVISSDSSALDGLSEVCPGTHVYVASIPGRNTDLLVDLVTELRKAGLEPVPHITARSISNRSELKDILARLRGEADVKRALLLGGDLKTPSGEFASSRALLETELLAKAGIVHVGFATYPEQHPRIDSHVLKDELRRKIELAMGQGMSSWLVSQFSFDADAIVDHAQGLRNDGIIAPLHVGIAGPTTLRSMAKFALICGVRSSSRALAGDIKRVSRLTAGYESREILETLLNVTTTHPELCISNPHFFTFGGVRKTVAWMQSLLRSDLLSKEQITASDRPNIFDPI